MDDIYNNMAIIDLHTHSTVSDGTMKPAEIFALAHELHLQAVALTDHDTVDGLAEFMATGAEHPECEAVPGVELACSFMNREIHIVGLFIDRNNPVLLEFIENARIERCRRNRDIFVKLELKGYPLDMSMPEFAGYTLDSIGRSFLKFTARRRARQPGGQILPKKAFRRGQRAQIRTVRRFR